MINFKNLISTNMKKRNILIISSMLLLASCGGGRSADNTSFFDMKGIILSWDDVKNQAAPDWINLLKESGINTISVASVPEMGYDQKEYLDYKQKCIDAGLDFEYEDHAMSHLVPRELFDEHPEYFRMDENGVRQKDGNGCPSCEEGLEVMMSNVKAFADIHHPTNHKYYFWLFDGGDICHCEKCKGLSASDQGLIFENHIIQALRKFDPEATLAHLAYSSTSPAPTVIRPEEGIFLEFAPFYRRWDKPLNDREALRDGQIWTHGDYLDMLEDNLKVFPAETAQVLEYWMDISQRSGWKKPAVQLDWHKEVYLEDLATYASYGIKNITAYAIYADENYLNAFHDLSFVKDYGKGLVDFKLEQDEN